MEKLEISLNLNNLTNEERKHLIDLIEKFSKKNDGLLGKKVLAKTRVRVINIEPHRSDRYICLEEYVGKTGELNCAVTFDDKAFTSTIRFDDEYMNVIDQKNGQFCWRYDEIELI